MRPWAPTLSPDDDLRSAIDTLASRSSREAPVLDAEGALVGILREEDCLRYLSNWAYGELEMGRVGDHMSAVAYALTEDMDLFRLVDAFLQSREPVLPVVRDGRLVGRITRQEILREVSRFDDALHRERHREHRDRWSREHPSGIEALQRLARDHTPGQLAEVLRNRPRYRRL